MPGINVLLSTNHLTVDTLSKCNLIQKRMLHSPSYAHHKVLSTERAVIGITAYPHYPHCVLKTPDTLIMIEGMIYNKSTLHKDLQELASEMVRTGSIDQKHLGKFVEQADGEFVIVFFNRKTEKIIVINDSLGRLPLFYNVQDSTFITSREVKFILPFLKSVRFNKLSLMEYLIYGFPFAKKTLIEDIYQLEPGSILTFDCRTGVFSKAETYKYHSISMGSLKRKDIVCEMKRHFMEGLTNRVKAQGLHRVILSLSGGLDSRATLAGLAHSCPNMTAVTIQSAEEKIAKNCANRFNIGLDTLSQSKHGTSLPNRNSIFLKDGLDSHPGQELFHHYLNQIHNNYGDNITYYTGLYGGELTRYSHPTSGFSSDESLIDYLLTANDHYKYSTENATSMLDVEKTEARETVKEYLDSFSDLDLYGKYRSFRFEYDRKCLGQGEDRNRYHFWSITPFTSLGFYRFVSSVDENMKDTRLYRDFLLAIDPRTCAIDYYNYGIPLHNTPLLLLLGFVERAIRIRRLKDCVRKLWINFKEIKFPHTTRLDILKAETLALVETTSPAQDYFSLQHCREIIQSDKSPKGIERLGMLLTYIDCAHEWHEQMSNV